jgi:beta-barrel assembly-enhancing protease
MDFGNKPAMRRCDDTGAMMLSCFRRPLLAALIGAALAAEPAAAQSPLPALGDAASETLPVHDEKRIGEMIMRDIRRDPAFLDDAVLQDYIDQLWQPLVAVARRQGHVGPDLDGQFALSAFLIRDPAVNAFALPGGHVGVFLGLIAMSRQPDELASVLAHELVHVTQRHIARSIESSQKIGPVGLAAMLLGVVAAAQGSIDGAQALMAGGQAAMIQGQLNFSRDMEREADRIGFGLLQGAGWNPAGMASMFELLASVNRLNDSGNFPYLRSHPLTAERIADARDRALGVAPPATVPLLHGLMTARAQVLMDSTSGTLRRWQADGGARADEPPLVSAYRQALVAAALRDAPAARQALERLRALAEAPEVPAAARRVARFGMAQTLLALGQAEAALPLLDAADASRPAQFLRAELHRAAFAALPEGDARRRQALQSDLEALQSRVAGQPGDFVAWQQLSLTAAAAGQPLRSQRAQAEASYAAGDLMGAIERLRGARRASSAGEAIEAQIVEARLRTLEAQRRELMASQNGRNSPR